MADERDYYEVLGVARDASAREIKSAYRKLAVRHHPDRNPGDREAETAFKAAAEAYSVLSDPDKRARYDRFGRQGVGGGFGGFDPETFGDFSDILGDFFGFGDIFGRSARRPGGGRPGADLRYRLELSLEEAAFGVEKTLEVPRLETCESCGGQGSEGGAEPPACSACGGRGQVRFTQGFFTVARPCPQCRGEGRVVTDPCRQCRGRGRVEKKRQLQVQVPAGVDNGTRMRLAGEGEHGHRGGPPGSLFVDLSVRPREGLERDGPHVMSTVGVTFPEAVLGCSKTVSTLHGDEVVEIPAGTPHGAHFRIKGKGIERLDRAGRGDHIVTVDLGVPHPRDLSEEEIENLRRLAELQGSEVRDGGGVLDKVKNLFA